MSSRSSTQTAHAPITLVDNTQPPPSPAPGALSSRSPSPASSTDNASRRCSEGAGRREILRKAIAERRYKRWPKDDDDQDDDRTEPPTPPPDPRADGVVVERAPAEEVVVDGPSQGEGNGERIHAGTPEGSTNGAAAGSSGRKPRRTGRRSPDTEIAEIDVLYENQRGWFCCGVPLFSSKSLLNFDPSPWQTRSFHDSPVSILDAQVPDPTWVWDWKSWYVDMTYDVDDEGWSYSFSFASAFTWHGNHTWFHSFVRRRRWLRKRVKAPQTAEQVDDDSASERQSGHRMNNDYFTIHSRKNRSSYHADGTKHTRRSVLEGGSNWDKAETCDSDEEKEIPDIPTLMKVVKRARLDREKMEAAMRFLEEGGEEIAYLPEKIPTIMDLMIFQASRHQLLARLLAYMDKYESENPDVSDPDKRKRKLDNLENAVRAGDEHVRRMEYWSDLKEVAKTGQSVGADQEGWADGLGISGAAKGKEREL